MFSVSAENDSRCPVRPKGNFMGDSVVCDHDTGVRVAHFNDYFAEVVQVCRPAYACHCLLLREIMRLWVPIFVVVAR